MAETLTNTNGAITLKQSTAFVRPFWFGTIGQTVAVTLSKNGGSFVALSTNSGNATEIANGWYSAALANTDVNVAGVLAYHASASTGGPVDFCDLVQATIFTDLSITGTGRVFLNSGVTKNQPLALPFVMTVSGVPTPGLTVTGQRNFGSGWSNITGTIVDLTLGCYMANLTAADTNANSAMYRFTATTPNTDDRDIGLQFDP